MIRQNALLFVWLLGMLFPVASFRCFSETYDRLYDQLFDPLWMHVLMHAFLFAVLAYLLAWPLARRFHPTTSCWRFALTLLGLVLVVAVLQEGFQLAYKARPLGADELLDVAVDVVGGGFGIAAFSVQVRGLSQLSRSRR